MYVTCFVVFVLMFSHVWLFATPWTAACQASLSFNISWSLLKFMSSELVMPSNHLVLCHPLLCPPSNPFPASGSLQMSQFFASGGQSIGISASASVLPMNIQDKYPIFGIDWFDLLAVTVSHCHEKMFLMLALYHDMHSGLCLARMDIFLVIWNQLS